MRGLYQAHAALKNRNSIEPTTLAHHLIRAASAVPQVVHQLVKQSLAGTIVDLGSMSTTFMAANRAIKALISGLDRLSHAEGGSEIQGSVIYAYVQMFAKLLDVFHDASGVELKRLTTNDVSTSASKSSSSTKQKAKTKQLKTANMKDKPALSAITTFLLSLIDLIQVDTGFHQSLYEGIAYCVLDRLGARLYTTTFGHAQGATVADEITASCQTNDIEESSSPPAARAEEGTELQRAKIEAPYLIHLLTHIMNIAPAHLGATISKRTGRAKQANNKGSMKGALAIAAKERLQRTLVNCIFGTEGVDESDPFMDCLRMPVLNAPPLPMPKVKEVDVQDWFREEVWRLLGWEILGKEGGW